MSEKCKKWHRKLRLIRILHAEFLQTYADALKFAEENPKIRETSFTRCRFLYKEIKPLVMDLREQFPRLTKEKKELLSELEAQYPTMKASLERRKISTEGMPTWEQVKKGLTPEVLDKALKLAEPALLLIPPTTRQSKVEAMNKYPATCQKGPAGVYELNDHNLWNGGKSQTENKWRVSIVEGIQIVEQDKEISDRKRTNYEMSKLWVEKYEKEGLNVMNDADSYLVLMMKRMDQGKPVDPRGFFTVLNGKNLTKDSLVAHGGYTGDRVDLYSGSPVTVDAFLRLRGSVGVDVPEAA